MTLSDELEARRRGFVELEAHLRLADDYLTELNTVRSSWQESNPTNLPNLNSFAAAGGVARSEELVGELYISGSINITGRLRYQSRIREAQAAIVAAEQSTYEAVCDGLRKKTDLFLDPEFRLRTLDEALKADEDIGELLDRIEDAEEFAANGARGIISDEEYNALENIEWYLSQIVDGLPKARGFFDGEYQRLSRYLKKADGLKKSVGADSPKYKETVGFVAEILGRYETYLARLEDEAVPVCLRPLWLESVEGLMPGLSLLTKAYLHIREVE